MSKKELGEPPSDSVNQDVFDSCRIEFEEDEQDRELVKQREKSPEIDVDFDDL